MKTAINRIFQLIRNDRLKEAQEILLKAQVAGKQLVDLANTLIRKSERNKELQDSIQDTIRISGILGNKIAEDLEENKPNKE